MRKPSRILLTVLLAAALLGGCVLPAPSVPVDSRPTPNPQQYTAAASTIVAQLTRLAGTPMTVDATAQSQQIVTPAPKTATSEPATRTPERVTVLPPFTATPSLATAITATAAVSLPLATPVMISATQVVTAVTPVPAGQLTGDPRVQLGPPTWRDDLAKGGTWPLYEDQHVRFTLANNQLEMTAFIPDKRDGWMLTAKPLKNFYLEVTAKTGACAGLDHFGLLGRASNDKNFYMLAISCDGSYFLKRHDGTHFYSLVSWTQNANIQAGADKINRLGLLGNGSTLGLYANGKLMTEIADTSLPEGSFGLFIGAVSTASFTVTVSEIALWELP